MKIRAIIIEDEMPARKTLKSFLKRYFNQIEVVGEAGDVESAKTLIELNNYDFVFMDIHLKDGNGIDILNLYTDLNLRIIFTTAFDNYTFDAFKHKAFGYLLKPLKPQSFKEIVGRVIKDVYIAQTEHLKLKVYSSKGEVWVNSESIVRCEAESNYAKIFTSTNECYMVSRTLKSIEQELNDLNLFVRVHHSHLVNIQFIDQAKIGRTEITLHNGETIPVSRSRKEDLKLKLERLI